MDLEHNTLVVFVSDNGPPKGYGFRGPLSGDKGSCLEGGVRIPTLVRWRRGSAGRAPSPRRSPPWTASPRSSPWPEGLDGGRELLFWGPDLVCGLRSGRWKYLRSGWWNPRAQLSDLETDPGETVNLIRDRPELAEQLEWPLRELQDL